MKTEKTVCKDVVIRFCGDSGDGMQLTGTLFSSLSAILGNEIATFPDYPADMRAPQGTIGGVSSFQVHVGAGIHTPGNECDVLVAMNCAALKVNHKLVKKGGVIIFDTDSFDAKNLEKALYKTDNPFTELGISETIQLVPVALTTLTEKSLEDFGMDKKAVDRCKNMFALGLICWLFNRPLEQAQHFLANKFAKKPDILKANDKVLTDGFNYGNNTQIGINTFEVHRSEDLPKGKYTIIAGNKATAWGLIAAAHKAGRELFLGSYPITPATDIMHELAGRKDMGVKVVQAEDEIAGVCTAIGASFAGDLAVTSTSGPGLSLKSEAIGLAVISETPIVVVDVMRGGPSTGLPTKTEQTDLLQAIYGRNGECPCVVIAASSSADCFDYAFQACKIALENSTPVILLTDAYLGNGQSLWRLPKLAELPEIHPSVAAASLKGAYNACSRDEETKVRWQAFPGMEGFTYRNCGLERDANKASISTDPANHALMIETRAKKVAQVANQIPDLKVEGDKDAEILLVGWGSTRGHLLSAMNEYRALGKKCALAHFNYIHPLPKNTAEVLGKYKKVVICELNSGQFAQYLRGQIPGEYLQYNKVEGQPFNIGGIVEYLKTL